MVQTLDPEWQQRGEQQWAAVDAPCPLCKDNSPLPPKSQGKDIYWEELFQVLFKIPCLTTCLTTLSLFIWVSRSALLTEKRFLTVPFCFRCRPARLSACCLQCERFPVHATPARNHVNPPGWLTDQGSQLHPGLICMHKKAKAAHRAFQTPSFIPGCTSAALAGWEISSHTACSRLCQGRRCAVGHSLSTGCWHHF